LSDRPVWPTGVARHVLDSVDSTNAHALREAPSLIGPAWYLAGEQTAGRGRRARVWASPRGNFHATLVMRLAEPPAVIALRSFAAALALREALAALTGLPMAFSLKWPNDVLLNGAKVAGILLESSGQRDGSSHLAVGIGVNLIAAPAPTDLEPGALAAVTVLAETGLRLDPGTLLDWVAPAFHRWDTTLGRDGFTPLRAEWLHYAARLGMPIRARTMRETHEGTFDTIDPAGNLVLATAQGRLAIPAADVFF
jgi:BirA family transcriptional regulator, biotin operon repressor / biotin---[acetyl-CoA-carboxylase] ligase